MKIIFLAVGKKHDSLYCEAVDEFTNRISRYSDIEWRFESASGKEGIGSSIDEGLEILNSIKENDFVIALDEKGKELTTHGLSKFLDSRMIDSNRRLVFVVGGAYGLSPKVIERANLVWSLSKLTLPHQLVRVVLSEQIYRAFTVIRGEKYHHA